MAICIGEQASGCEDRISHRSGGGILHKANKHAPRTNRPAACVAILLLLVYSSITFAQPTNSTPTPEVKPAARTNPLAGFQIEPGFRIETAVQEPMILNPAAMAFDENGRLFVVELPGLADRHAGKLGRVRMLDNLNEHGVFQNSTIYADSLSWPSAVACYAGGIFVATGSEIVYLKDTKGDGVADARQVVLSGFGRTNLLDPNLLINNLNWGPDNRIHGSSGGIGGDISSQGSGGVVSIDGADFSFDPRSLEVVAETGPSQSGLTFDNSGRQFVSDFLRPLLTPNYQLRYLARNPYCLKPPGLAQVADPNAPVYRLAPENGPINQKTNLLGPMSMARGCAVYRGRAFPTNYFDNVFVADPEAHLIHRLVVRKNGLEATAQRAPGEKASEFLASRDPAFRPVQLINGPDGALYVADVREDTAHGRIYRILPANVKTKAPAQLGRLKTYDLVSILAQGDGWHRDTAQRLLYERKDPAAPALLRATLNHSRLAQARVLALQALAGAGALHTDDALKALRDDEPEVRRHGLILVEPLLANGNPPPELLAQLRVLAQDPSPGVRDQLAFTAGSLPAADKAPLLSQMLVGEFSNPWMPAAALSSVSRGAGDLFTALAANPRVTSDPAGIGFIEQLALMIGLSGQLDAVSETAGFIARDSLNPGLACAFLYQLGEGLYRTRSSLPLVDSRGVLQPFFSGALTVATDPSQPESVRIAATRLVGASPLATGPSGNWLVVLCGPPSTPAVQAAAIDTLSRHDDPDVVRTCLEIWSFLAPAARTRAVTALLSRDSRLPAVLNAIQNGSIPAAELSSVQKDFLRTSPDPAVRQRAQQLFGPLPVERPAVMSRLKPALDLPGSIDRGREIFRQRCAACHQSSAPGQSRPLGPDLLRARTFTRQELLAKIVEPNANVRPDYTTQVVQSKDGENMVGIVSDENRWTLTLAQAGGNRLVWPQVNVGAITPRSWSLMPDGLEQGLGTQDMADLLEYLRKGK